MEFENYTPFPAELESGSTGEQEMLGIIGCKITYIAADGRLSPVTDDQAWPVFNKPYVFRGVTLNPELDYRKRGVDLLVFGAAKAPQGKPVAVMPVDIECGKIRCSATVFGDRKWQKSSRGFRISAPVPFTEMPLTNDRAFGGTAKVDEEAVPHPINPDGCGFCMTPEEVAETSLPNLEQPLDPIQKWTDQPAPACFYKPSGPIGLKGLLEKEFQEIQSEMMASLFTQSVPCLHASQPEDLGDEIRLRGFSPDGILSIPVPTVSGPVAHVSVGIHRSRFPSTLSTLIALVPEGVLIASYICMFRYLFQPMENRRVELREPVGRMTALV